jgi:hypothetical protein
MRLLKSALFVVIVSAFFVSGCKSSASIAYQIDHATERSKYVRETYLDTGEMEALKKYSSELESKVLDVDLNRHQFARHLSAIQNGNQRGIHEQQTLSRRIQD